ncbi:class I SAM-dependent methyltransferase [Pseudarthrobacter sp. NPDC058329]|uniref:class I SAM-dependent methyltransferase n=1 Tax=Pseudarthrobacter sp. NPDC058329 TaxID=3346448 RepID=UPI0036DF50B8
MSSPSWYPNELALAGRENLDMEHVARYDGKMDSSARDELSVLKGYGLNAQSTIIEFGAGTGQLTVEAARACARVVAVDVSPPMLAYLETKLSDQDLTNVTLVNAGFLSYTQPESQADFVYSRYALHHLPDFWKAIALDRMRKLLSPGGICRLWDVVYDFNPADATGQIETWCSQGGANVDGEWSRDEFEEHIRDEHSTFRWLLEPMIERAGFDIVEVQYTAETFDAKYVLRAT